MIVISIELVILQGLNPLPRFTTRLWLGNFVKRLVRTRMPGVVGGWGRKSPVYPIMLYSFNSDFANTSLYPTER